MQSWHSFQDFPILKCNSTNAAYSVAIAVKGAAYSARQVHSLSWTLKRLAAWQGQEIGGFFCSYTLKSLKITLFIFVGKLWMLARNKEMVWAHLNGLLKLALVARLLKTVPKVTEWWCGKDFTPGWDSQPSKKRSHPQFSIYNFIVKIFWND